MTAKVSEKKRGGKKKRKKKKGGRKKRRKTKKDSKSSAISPSGATILTDELLMPVRGMPHGI